MAVELHIERDGSESESCVALMHYHTTTIGVGTVTNQRALLMMYALVDELCMWRGITACARVMWTRH